MNIYAYKTDLFPKVIQITNDGKLPFEGKMKALDGLEKEEHSQHAFNLHRYKIPVDEVLQEQFWKALQCKAVQPTLVVKRIKECKILNVYSNSHFKRQPIIEGVPPLEEDVTIDQKSKTVLFVAEKNHFVAVNRLINESGTTYFEGIYFDGLGERTEEEFLRSADSLVDNIKELIKNQDMNQLYQQSMNQLS